MELLNKVQHNQSPIIRGFGLELDTNFAKVPARCLNAPKIQYSGNKLVEVKNGVWRGEGMPFLIPESANKWAILNANQRTKNNELQELAEIVSLSFFCSCKNCHEIYLKMFLPLVTPHKSNDQFESC